VTTRAERVVLTGASGFVGSAVLRGLVAEGRTVAVLLRETSNTRRISALLDRVTVIRADIGDLGPADEALRAFAPDAVAHLAWQGVFGADRNDPIQLGNVNASIDLYRRARAAGARRFVGLGSQAEYGPCQDRVDESVPTRPTTLYGAAKLSTYWLLDRLAAADGGSFAWLRLFSCYGPDDDARWLIPSLVLSLLAGKRPSLTAGEQRWDYVHVDDVAAAVIHLLDSDATGPFNCGSGEAHPLRDIVSGIRDRIDPALPLGLGEVPYRPDQVMHLEAGIDRLAQATGWAPRIPLDTGLDAVVGWYRAQATGSGSAG